MTIETIKDCHCHDPLLVDRSFFCCSALVCRLLRSSGGRVGITQNNVGLLVME